MESSEFKRSVITYYDRATVVDVDGEIRTANCMVANTAHNYGDLCPAHLVKHSQPALMTTYGLLVRDIDNPRNGLLLLKMIEEEFDRKNVCFVRNPVTGGIIFKVLCPAIMTKRIFPSSLTEVRTFSDIDNNVLQLPDGVFPYRRILYMHSKYSYARALHRGWLTADAELHNFFAVSEAGLEEPEFVRGLTWQQINYADIETAL